jgi:hypothetical protein
MTDLKLNVGVCIYCGDTKGPLTREHVIPRGLGGNVPPQDLSDALVLQKATCERCRRITAKIEEDCLLPMMNHARARLGLKRKDRADATMETLIEMPDGTTGRRVVAADEALGMVLIPSFYEAGALTSKPITDTAPCDYQIVLVAPAPDRAIEEGG